MITEVYESKCTGCGNCFNLCPLDVLRLDTHREEAPACQTACPAGVDMRGYIYLLKLGKIEEAAALMRDTLPLPAVTGRVCFHPCETECFRKDVDEATNIISLERYVADYMLNEKAKPAPRLHTARVAVAGSGPAGLSAAYFLVRMGYPVTVFESMPELGGMLRYGIPEYRLPRKVLDKQIQYIRNLGVEFKTGVAIGNSLTVEDLKDQGYKAVLLAFGAWQSMKLNIPGEQLTGVTYGLEFLKDVNAGKKAAKGKRVVVIGGGNVAVDATRAAIRTGAKEVSLLYRRSRQEMPANGEEIAAAEAEGVKIIYLAYPIRILGSVKAEGLECQKMELGERGADGRRKPVAVKNSEYSVLADQVIVATGEAPELAHWAEGKLAVTSKGMLQADAASPMTSLPRVFAAGDVVSGPSSVVEAIASGKKAANAIDLTLKGQEVKPTGQPKKVENPPGEGMEKRPRQSAPVLPVADRVKGFSEIKAALNEKQAAMEAERCMTCGSKAYIAYPEDCMTCYTCELKCPYSALYVHPFKEILPCAIEYPEGGNQRG
jgi:NADPH-dependent glutamate synthase beta subunit-like oxidoreductase